MARPLRIQYSGALYHVMNRGANHQTIFCHPEEDRRIFYGVLAKTTEFWKIRIHAYALMNNHYHLLIETPLPNLSRSMKHVDGLYTQWFNKRHGRDGSLLRGRFKSILVEKESYFLELIRYIHLNGVRAGLYPSPAVDPNCSHRGYMNPDKAPPWLTTEMGLSFFQGGKSPIQELDNFVKQGVPKELGDKLDAPKWPALLGEPKFIESIKEKYLKNNCVKYVS